MANTRSVKQLIAESQKARRQLQELTRQFVERSAEQEYWDDVAFRLKMRREDAAERKP